jgi:hypothetical protein
MVEPAIAGTANKSEIPQRANARDFMRETCQG